MTLANRDALLSELAGVQWPFVPLLDALAVTATAEVVDVGAGDGTLLKLLRQRGHLGCLEGLDPNPGEGIQAGQAEALPYPDHSFDMVLLIRVLPHLAHPETALQEAERVLRPGGQLIWAANANGEDHLRELWRAVGQTRLSSRADAPWQSALKQANWAVERQDIRLQVQITADQAQAILQTYAEESPLNHALFPIQDMLNLHMFKHKK